MKVLLINGSPRQGNTFMALQEVEKALHEDGIETQIIHIGNQPQRDCIGCGACVEKKYCAFGGDTYEAVRAALPEADGIIVGSPVYYAGPTGALCSLLDRLFYSCGRDLKYKPAASVVVCRRGGASSAFERLNKYFTIACMPVVSSQYWNCLYGQKPGEVAMDEEGMQTMRTLGHNMAWTLKALSGHPRPQKEKPLRTNFIR